VAAARPAVTIAEFTDAAGRTRPGSQPRDEIYLAVQRADTVDLVPFAKVKAAAARKGVRVADLSRPAKLAQVAYAVGADAVVTGFVARGALQVRIFDSAGKEVWEKQVPLQRGQLSRELADRFAAAIAAAVGLLPGVGRSEPETGPERPSAVERPRAVATSPPRAGETSAAPRRDEPETEPEGTGVVELPAPRRRPSEPSRSDAPGVTPPPSPPRDLAAPSLLHAELTVTTTWRSYRFCPEVENCDQTPPVNAGSPVRYSTDKPYGGLLLTAELFLLHDRDNLLRGIGLAGSFGRSLFLKTHYLDADRVEHQFSSAEQRASAEAMWRLYFRLEGPGEGYVGLRGGWRWHWFLLDENPKIVESRRGGLFGGAEVAFPLHRYVHIEASFFGIPLAGPGEKERAAYGAAASGGGFAARGGFSSNFGDPALHLGAAVFFDYVHYGDRFANEQGVHPEFGRALEDYAGIHVGVRTRW
jgi:hypothetical protein